jgi:hypothetical protein
VGRGRAYGNLVPTDLIYLCNKLEGRSEGNRLPTRTSRLGRAPSL